MTVVQGIDPRTLPYAPRRNRLLGQIADALIAALPTIALGVFGGPNHTALKAAMLWSVGYYLLADGMEGGQSFGKRWLGMRVIDEKTGKPCTWGQSLGRNLVLAMLGPVDMIFILGEKHQRLGDKAAGTIVVEAD